MEPQALLETLTNLVLAVAALAGLGGAGFYMVQRRSNGRTALPGSAHDETVEALNGIKREVTALHKTVKESNGRNGREHEEILNAVAPRDPIAGRGG